MKAEEQAKSGSIWVAALMTVLAAVGFFDQSIIQAVGVTTDPSTLLLGAAALWRTRVAIAKNGTGN